MSGSCIKIRLFALGRKKGINTAAWDFINKMEEVNNCSMPSNFKIRKILVYSIGERVCQVMPRSGRVSGFRKLLVSLVYLVCLVGKCAFQSIPSFRLYSHHAEKQELETGY